MLITVFSISCKNNSTMSEFAYDYGTFEVDADKGIEQYADMDFISTDAIAETQIFHLWVRITNSGILYTQGTTDSEPNFSTGFTEIPVSVDGFKKDNARKYTFSGVTPDASSSSTSPQTGTLTFDENAGTLTIKFTAGPADNLLNKDIVCRYVVW